MEGFEIMVPLKYLTNFWRTLEMPPLINCEISLILAWPKSYVMFILMLQIKVLHL